MLIASDRWSLGCRSNAQVINLELHVASAEELKVHAAGINLLNLEKLSHLKHKLLGTTDVVFSGAVAQVEVFLGDLGQIHTEVVVVGNTVDVGFGEVSLENVCAEVGTVASDTADLVVERDGSSRAVDPGDGSVRLAFGNGVKDRHHGSDANTSRDENDGDVRGVGHIEVKLAGWVSQLNNISLVLHVDEEVRNNTGVEGIAAKISATAGHMDTLVSLNGNTVVVRSGSLAQRILAGLNIALIGDWNLNRDILARLERRKTLAVNRNEVERVDVIRFLNLLLDAELAVALPLSKVSVELSLTADEHLGKHPVGFCPSLSDLRSHGRAEDLCEGGNEILLDNGVVLWLNTQGTVLVAHTLHLGNKLCDVVDVVGVAEDDGSKSTRLSTVCLVDCVEVVVELGVVTKHVAVEDGCDALSVVSQGGDGAPDELGLLVGQSHCDSGRLVEDMVIWYYSQSSIYGTFEDLVAE